MFVMLRNVTQHATKKAIFKEKNTLHEYEDYKEDLENVILNVCSKKNSNQTFNEF